MARISRYFETARVADGTTRMRVRLEGAALLRMPLLNKGTSFSAGGARRARPRRPPAPARGDARRAGRAHVRRVLAVEPTPLAKYSNLRALQERNEILFYALLERHLAEMLPIIYTPTVGDAVKNASAIYQNARGLSLSPINIGRAAQVAGNCILDDVRIIVATDSSAILGIGDQGWGGLAISIGKLALYTAAGGVSPYRSLPIGLDVGTDREDLLKSPVVPRRAPAAPARRASTSRSWTSSSTPSATRWPRAVLQWEDLSKDTAFEVLERYRKKLPSFNDDIQGTGAVALAGLVGACALRGRKVRDEIVVVHGAGAGGAGRRAGRPAGDDARGAHARRGARARLRARLEGAARRGPQDGGLQAGPRAAGGARRGLGQRAVPARGDDRPVARDRAPRPLGAARVLHRGDGPRDVRARRAARSSSRCRTRRRRARRRPRTCSRGATGARSSRRAARSTPCASTGATCPSGRATTRSSSRASASAPSSPRRARSPTGWCPQRRTRSPST